jgi:hypothetical protein
VAYTVFIAHDDWSVFGAALIDVRATVTDHGKSAAGLQDKTYPLLDFTSLRLSMEGFGHHFAQFAALLIRHCSRFLPRAQSAHGTIFPTNNCSR